MSEKAVLFIHALSALHPGSGTAQGLVDLPVQREKHNEWPVIQGSSIKGVLRDACRRAKIADTDIDIIFGPDTQNADKHAGALSVGDAKIIAFPVRSLAGTFAWTSCPQAWGRMQRDLSLLTGWQGIPPCTGEIKQDKIWLSEKSLLKAGKDVVLEEFSFAIEGENKIKAEADWLADNAISDPTTANRLKQAMAMVSDDDFTYFVRNCTEVIPRIALDYESKTTKEGALFYEEFLPTESIFYAPIIVDDSRNSENKLSAAVIIERLVKELPKVIQFGAGQTIGKGLCAVKLSRAGKNP